MTNYDDGYTLIIAHRAPAKDNLGLGHVSARLVHPEAEGNNKHHVNVGHSVMKNYAQYADAQTSRAAKHHVAKNVSIAVGLGLAGAATGLSEYVNYLGASALGVGGTFLGAAWRGHDLGPGHLVLKEQDFEKYDCRHYHIPITEEQYHTTLERAEADQGPREFALWDDNCAVYILDILKDILEIEMPVERAFLTETVDITTPRYVERIFGSFIHACR